MHDCVWVRGNKVLDNNPLSSFSAALTVGDVIFCRLCRNLHDMAGDANSQRCHIDVRFCQYIRPHKRFIDDLFLKGTGPVAVLCNFRCALATADEAMKQEIS